MKEKKVSKIDYEILLKDFVIVNIVIGGTALVVVGIMLLQRYDILPSIPCGVHEFLNVYCPGCGGTRALFALLHGQILQSLICNPAILFGAVLIFYYEIGVILTLVKKDGKRYFYQKCGLLYGYLAVVIVFAVIRDWLLIGFQIDLLKDFI